MTSTPFSRRTAVKAAGLAAGSLALPLPGTASAAGGSTARVLGTERIGQLTGSTHPVRWPDLVDAEGWPLLVDTGRWAVTGVDLGACAEHSDGRLYFFFGDVATNDTTRIPRNADLVAWTDERTVLRRGGHQRIGDRFVLPSEGQGVPGQAQWRFCGRCHGLFFNGDANFKGRCPKGGAHSAIGLNFTLPHEPTGTPGQPDWRFCGKCAGLFFDGDPRFKGACPGGDAHSALGWRFVLPREGTGVPGQSEWRFCGRCAGLHWDGDAAKGVCPGAPGGGFPLRPVLGAGGEFDPFTATAPVGLTRSLEVPSGAFSHRGRMYVFTNISPKRWSEQDRPGEPAYGTYLVSKDRPDLPGPFQTEYLFSPRIGACATGDSHTPLGVEFVLPHDIRDGVPRQTGWRFCARCASMFRPGPANRCHRGGAHEAAGFDFALPQGIAEDVRHQGNWFHCGRCSTLYWDGDPANKGRCPAGGAHQRGGAALQLPHVHVPEDANNQRRWRFCGKCAGMFWGGDLSGATGVCPQGGGHEAVGLEFVLPHGRPETPTAQQKWRFCAKCFGLYFNGGDRGRCPAAGAHEPLGLDFTLPHSIPTAPYAQAGWRFCGGCAGLFFGGAGGRCPRGGAHQAAGVDFVLSHNPGADNRNQAAWRFCSTCFAMHFAGQPDSFGGVAPVVVTNAEHPGLPATPHRQGLVMFCFGYSPSVGFRLAWLPLSDTGGPVLREVRYHTGSGWSADPGAAKLLIGHQRYTSVSAAWLPGPRRWVLLYSHANDVDNFTGPVVARFGATPWDLGPEVRVFDPVAAGAYTRYMHKPGADRIHPDIPPSQPPGYDNPGWAYGAFVLNRFTEWNDTDRTLGLYYLLSTSSPYQVHLMHTRLTVT